MELFDDSNTSGYRLWSAIVSPRGAALVLILGAVLASLSLALAPAPRVADTPASSLPTGAESTQVALAQARAADSDVAPAVVVFDRGGQALTPADRQLIDERTAALQAIGLPGGSPAVTAPDGSAALVSVPLRLGADDLSDSVTELRKVARADLPDGLRAQVTGAPAYEVDLSAVFNGANATLLLTTAGVVAALLLLTYRSPALWLVPLLVVGLADQVSVRLLGWATEAFGFQVDDAITGITSVLVFGAGTNYALLLIARYREELRRHDSRRRAMSAALHRAGPAIIASSSTVVLALLTLSLADDPFNRALGYAGALGIATAVVAALTLLPVALVIGGRGLFWPFVPKVGQPDPSGDGLWARIAREVGRRPWRVLIASGIVIGGLVLLLPGFHVGLSQDEQFRETPEAVTGQQALARAFPAGAAEPTVVVTPSDRADEVTAAAADVEGVASVRPGPASGGMTQLDVVLTAPRGSDDAAATVERLRERLPADALVGGPDAEDVDARATARHDQRLVIPAILAVVLLVLLLLLRSVVAAVVLVATVVATYAAALGAGWWVSHDLLGFPAFDRGVPLLTFLFLVALGVDYNIFLSTRAREEARHVPTPRAIAVALAVTGGVITSAGILLAAVFTVLGVLPVVTLTQIGVVVGIGVLLDTLVVRSLLVPALVTVIGERFWWPSHPSKNPAGSEHVRGTLNETSRT
ncbi:MMPL family transporter [Nocardioides panacihumi]|uniref:MMPL family transporter n=1 Tax=Nocardioides panacihumi TaxID=400774 RepID=A0ABP5BP98_9ACTN